MRLPSALTLSDVTVMKRSCLNQAETVVKERWYQITYAYARVKANCVYKNIINDAGFEK